MTKRLRWSVILLGWGFVLFSILPAQAELIQSISLEDPETRALQLGGATLGLNHPAWSSDLRGMRPLADPDNEVSLLHNAAVASFDRKDFKSAAAVARRAIKADPQHAGARYMLGSSLLALKQWDAAKQALLKSLRIRPRTPHALGNLAIAHYELGETAQALELLIEAFELKIDYSDGWSNYLTILSRELVPREGLDRLPLPPDDEDAARWHWSAAMAAMKAGNAQQSTRHFLRSLSLNLNDPNVHNDFAVLLLQVDSKVMALPFLKAASRLTPDSNLVRDNLATVRREVREDVLNAQVEALEKSVGMEDSADARLALAKLYEQLGQKDKAIQNLRQAVELEPDEIQYHIELAQSLSRSKQHAQAVAAFRRVVQSDPKDPRWMFREAWLILKQQPEPGSPELRRAIQQALHACKATEYRRMDCLNLLAQALKLDGDVSRSQKVEKAMDLLAEKQAREGGVSETSP